MHSLQSKYIKKLVFDGTAISALKTIGEYKGKQALFFTQTPEILNTLKQVSIIESSESSNRLEGITAPHKRIEGIVLQSTQPRNRSEQEIAGYRDAINIIHESAEHMPFSENIILQMHSMLYRYLPSEGGFWKKTDNQIAERDADGRITRIRFKPTSAVATPGQMTKFIEYYDVATRHEKEEPLVIIPLAILDFLCIHPFSDGNGRVARLLTLLLLYHFGYEVGRYISLERIFEESSKTYYESLEKSSAGWHDGTHDVMPWVTYFWGVLLRAYKEFEDRVGSIRAGKGSKTEQIRKAVERKIGPFSISDIERECAGTSRDMVRRVLRQLRDEGIIVSTGKGRNAKWKKKEI
ncbi:MAG: Fic family protein [Candidatus Brocadiales bacterium]|nr:Fic family protein [Candidatus Brocadiales bacterium]